MKFLIIEENPGLRRLLLALLSESGDEIRECAEGTEALSLCALEQPDWVVLDLNLARADGLSLTRQIRNACPQTRVLLVADEDDARLCERATQAGAAHFIAKERLTELPALLRAA
jgi:two-component system, NarL family, nitrate/nitrite response regulator NarL